MKHLTLSFFILVASAVANAKAMVKLECLFSTIPDTVPREVVLTSGARYVVNCQTGSCLDKNFKIVLGYNDTYSDITLQLEDKKTTQFTQVQYENVKVGSSLVYATDNARSGRFLNIRCKVKDFFNL